MDSHDCPVATAQAGRPYRPPLLGPSSRRGEEEPMEIVAIMMILGMHCIPKISININLNA